jgi:transcriptional regulator with XRE-family HTH domain
LRRDLLDWPRAGDQDIYQAVGTCCQSENDSSYNRTVRSSPCSCPSRSFGVLLRHWRSVRRVSQLDLSLDAELSTRHLSCVETGRAQPSREVVLRLAEALQVPLRERNALLLAAGYAPLYRYTGLDAPEVEAARRAVELLMAQLEPYPVLEVTPSTSVGCLQVIARTRKLWLHCSPNFASYNKEVLANCAACPRCGAWIVIHRDTGIARPKGKTLVECRNPQCSDEKFEVANETTQVFDVDRALFDRRYFFASDLQLPAITRRGPL